MPDEAVAQDKVNPGAEEPGAARTSEPIKVRNSSNAPDAANAPNTSDAPNAPQAPAVGNSSEKPSDSQMVSDKKQADLQSFGVVATPADADVAPEDKIFYKAHYPSNAAKSVALMSISGFMLTNAVGALTVL